MTNPRELVERLNKMVATPRVTFNYQEDVDAVAAAATALSAALDREERLEADNIRLRLEVAESVSEEDYEKLLAVRRVEIDANNACHEEITRLRDFITALEDGNMTFLCDQLDRAKEENNRLRGLLEEAKGAAERIAKQSAWKTIEAPYSLRTKLDQAQDAASSLLKRLEGE